MRSELITLGSSRQTFQINRNKLFTYKAKHVIKELIEPLEDLKSNTIPSPEKFYPIIKFIVKRHIRRFHPGNRLPVEDICWDCFTHLFVNDNRANFLGRYDSRRSKLHTYVTHGVKNYLIDLERKSGKLSFVYESEDIIQFLSDANNPYSNETIDIIQNLLEEIRPEVIGYLKTRKSKKRIKLKNNSYIYLSEFIVVRLILAGYNHKEISNFFEVSPRYIGKLYERSVSLLKSVAKENNMNISNELQGYYFDNNEILLLVEQLNEKRSSKNF
jgi:hypothetical protein